jgi:hypothetical protein
MYLRSSPDTVAPTCASNATPCPAAGFAFRLLGVMFLLRHINTLVFSVIPPGIIHSILYAAPIAAWCVWRLVHGPICLVPQQWANHRVAHIYMAHAGATHVLWSAARSLALVVLSCKQKLCHTYEDETCCCPHCSQCTGGPTISQETGSSVFVQVNAFLNPPLRRLHVHVCDVCMLRRVSS